MPRRNLAGLDSLRFVAALFVLFSHSPAFPFRFVFGQSGFAANLSSAYELMFNGVAAVLVFFTLSGVCIHYSFASGAQFRSAEFLARRLLRICIPVGTAFLLANEIGQNAIWPLRLVLWSLYCEIVYYVVYPALRPLLTKSRIIPLIAASVVISLTLIGFNWNTGFYQEYPMLIMWLVPWPAWLLGCLLANRVASRQRACVPGSAGFWRAVVWLYSSAALLLFFHGSPKLSHAILLMPFSFLVFFWIGKEIERYESRKPWRILERCGRWSYSLYLVHFSILTMVGSLALTPLLSWIMGIIASLAGAFIFYIAVEWPSHRFARYVGHRIRNYRIPGLESAVS